MNININKIKLFTQETYYSESHRQAVRITLEEILPILNEFVNIPKTNVYNFFDYLEARIGEKNTEIIVSALIKSYSQKSFYESELIPSSYNFGTMFKIEKNGNDFFILNSLIRYKNNHIKTLRFFLYEPIFLKGFDFVNNFDLLENILEKLNLKTDKFKIIKNSDDIIFRSDDITYQEILCRDISRNLFSCYTRKEHPFSDEEKEKIKLFLEKYIEKYSDEMKNYSYDYSSVKKNSVNLLEGIILNLYIENEPYFNKIGDKYLTKDITNKIITYANNNPYFNVSSLKNILTNIMIRNKNNISDYVDCFLNDQHMFKSIIYFKYLVKIGFPINNDFISKCKNIQTMSFSVFEYLYDKNSAYNKGKNETINLEKYLNCFISNSNDVELKSYILNDDILSNKLEIKGNEYMSLFNYIGYSKDMVTFKQIVKRSNLKEVFGKELFSFLNNNPWNTYTKEAFFYLMYKGYSLKKAYNECSADKINETTSYKESTNLILNLLVEKVNISSKTMNSILIISDILDLIKDIDNDDSIITQLIPFDVFAEKIIKAPEELVESFMMIKETIFKNNCINEINTDEL